ncbi:prorelaxin H2-like isoform X3 [Branchiostoma lanceolatum]|uniref:prorelaxin H2-like isoform X3 n=1 Tax=Branchiostoma lanceolatum TaxID=7740 RepID=UPI0034561C24
MGGLYRTVVVTVLLLSVLSPSCQVFGVKLCGRSFLRATFLVCGMHKRSGHDATRQDFSESRPPGYKPPSVRTSRSSLLHDDPVHSTLSSLPTYTTNLPTLAPFDFWNVASVLDLARMSADETREEEKRRGRGRGKGKARGRGRPRGRGRYAYKGIADYCCRKGCSPRQLAVVC